MSKNKKSNKLKDMSDSEVLTLLKKYPYKTKQYNETFEEMKKRTAKKYPNQFVLADLNKFDHPVTSGRNFPLAVMNGLFPFKEVEEHLLRLSGGTVYNTDSLRFYPREEVEFNYKYKQLMVYGYITDYKGRIILLRKKDNNMITFIGGHVDYDLSVYSKSVVEVLEDNLRRELSEEISGLDEQVNVIPQYFVNTFSRFQDIFHMAIIYKIEVYNADDLFKKINSGEPSKHTLVKFHNLIDLDNECNEEKARPWVLDFIEHEIGLMEQVTFTTGSKTLKV